MGRGDSACRGCHVVVLYLVFGVLVHVDLYKRVVVLEHLVAIFTWGTDFYVAAEAERSIA